MDVFFFAGLLLGALLGLAVDLWKRPLDRLLDRRLENRTSAHAQALSNRLAKDRQGLRDFLMVQILETTLIGSLAAILSGLLFTIPNIVFTGLGGSINSSIGRWANVPSVLGQIIAVAAAGMIVRIASDAISIANKVAEFNEPSPVDNPATEGTSP